MRVATKLALSGLLGLSAVGALAQPQDAGSQEQQSVDLRTGPTNSIIVEGERQVEEEEVRDAVRDIAMRGRTNLRPMTRFQAPLCLQVAGLGDRFNAQVADRIRANTKNAGFAVAEEGCEHNAVVAVVKDPEELIARLRKDQPRLFTPKTNQKIKAAQRRGDVAVGWSVSRIAGVRGRPLPENGSFAGAGVAGAATVSQNANQGVPTTNSGGVSRFKIPYSLERVFSVLVFDVERMSDVHLDQLADFATIKLLADPQPVVELDEEARASTILSLFDTTPREAPQRMTQLDRAFLRGLYALRPNDPSTRLEKFVLAAYEDIRKEDCATRARGVCRETP